MEIEIKLKFKLSVSDFLKAFVVWVYIWQQL